jgi:hypothetical protein
VCQLHGQALVRLKARLADWRTQRDRLEQEDNSDGKRPRAKRTQRTLEKVC